MENRLTSSYPPAPSEVVTKTPHKPTPEMQSWLQKGWQAHCCSCHNRFTSHDKPGDTKCPRCGDIPTVQSGLAAIESMPQPQTDAWNKREARRASFEAERAKKSKKVAS